MNTSTDSVRIVLFDKNNKDLFLILSEVDDPTNTKLPGGRFESRTETPEEASIRELQEELGLSPDQINLQQVSELINEDGFSKRYIFKANVDPILIVPSNEIDHVSWVAIDNVPEGKNQHHIKAAVLSCLSSS